ncbi:hypothetical protein [Weissella cibaria]|uniref:hypothetical protein n=1 Tax=Weissella cibaria TaxID=137591 RepID=UPI00189755BA|nr:hypothetical protein [Weissella cibaria]
MSQWCDAEDAFFPTKTDDQRIKDNIKALTRGKLDNKADVMLQNVTVEQFLNERSVDERIVKLLETKQNVFDVYADCSAAADENVEAKSITEGTVVKEIIEEERERYNVG